MNPACECPLAGYCKRHQLQKGDRSHKYCQGVGDNAWKYWEAWEQGKLGATAPEAPMLNRSQFGDGDEPDGLSTIGTALESIFVRVTGMKIECPDCQRAILRLNSMTPDQVEADRVAIVADIKGRIPEQAPAIWKALAFVDNVLHLGQTEAKLNTWLSEAITTGGGCPPSKKKTKRPAKQPPAGVVARPRPGRRPYAGWRSDADGPRIQFGPLVSSVRHLTYHVWASNKGDSWQWNLEQLAKRWRLFNGKKIIGIVEDKDAKPADVVLQFAESLGMVFDHHVIRPNKEKLREVVTWVPMLSLLKPESAGANEVVFSGHAKGQKYDDPAHTRDWTDLMYQSCLDDWPSVYNALRTSLMAGSMREYGLLGKWHNWAYSGTFYWWRLAEIGKRNWRDVDQWFAGTESWPGKMCDARETACLFLNDSRRMYEQQYWTDVVWPEWHRYLQQRK